MIGYEEALWLKKLEISHASQILTNEHQILVYFLVITTVSAVLKFIYSEKATNFYEIFT